MMILMVTHLLSFTNAPGAIKQSAEAEEPDCRVLIGLNSWIGKFQTNLTGGRFIEVMQKLWEQRLTPSGPID
jgi:hypothetical protein